MRCDRIAPQLKPYLDGETSYPQTVGIRRHLRHCLDCAAQLKEWQNLNALLKTGDLFAAPATPPTIAMPATLPVLSNIDRAGGTSKGKTAMRLKLVTGVTAAALALILLSGRGRHSTSMAAEIRRAVSGVNTWHLKGWKLQNGKPMRWEVWGRKTPFFYREQVGEDVIVDDGARRVSVFAPLRRNGGQMTGGVVLKTPSLPDAPNVRWSYQRMAARWNGSMKPDKQTGDDAVFNFPESGIFSGGDMGTSTDLLYTVSKHTWLPIRYETRLGKADHKQTISHLDADYNAPLPTDVAAAPATPAGFKVYDATQPAPRGENIATLNGITVQAMPLVLTPDGMVLLRIKTWMGGALIDRSGPLLISVYPDRWNEVEIMGTPANTDERKRGYTQVGWDAVEDGSPDSKSVLTLLAPVDTLPKNAAPPTRLALKLDVSSQMDTRLSGTMGLGDQQLSRQTMRLTIALPAPAGSNEPSILACLRPDWKQRCIRDEGRENLPAAVDEARAVFYGSYVDGRNPDRPRLQRSLMYSEKYFLESSRPYMIAMGRSRCAQTYTIMGNKTRARQLLQAIVDEKHMDAQLQPANNPMMSKLTPAQLKTTQAESRQLIERMRAAARHDLRTLAR